MDSGDDTAKGDPPMGYSESVLSGGSVFIQGYDAAAAARAATVAELMPDGEVHVHFQLASTNQWRSMNHRYGYTGHELRQHLCGNRPWLEALEAMAVDAYGRRGDGVEHDGGIDYSGIDYSDTQPHAWGAVTFLVHPPAHASAHHQARLRRREQQAHEEAGVADRLDPEDLATRREPERE